MSELDRTRLFLLNHRNFFFPREWIIGYAVWQRINAEFKAAAKGMEPVAFLITLHGLPVLVDPINAERLELRS